MAFVRGIFRFFLIVAVGAIAMHACGQDPAELNTFARRFISPGASNPAPDNAPPAAVQQPVARPPVAQARAADRVEETFGNLTEKAAATKTRVRSVLSRNRSRATSALTLPKLDLREKLAEPGWIEQFRLWLNQKLLQDRNRADPYSTRGRLQGRRHTGK